MTIEQENSLLAYIANRLDGCERRLSSDVVNLLVSYSLLRNFLNQGLIEVEPFVKLSLQLIEGFKKNPLTQSLIKEYEDLNS